jgi:hypothetical protein
MNEPIMGFIYLFVYISCQPTAPRLRPGEKRENKEERARAEAQQTVNDIKR